MYTIYIKLFYINNDEDDECEWRCELNDGGKELKSNEENKAIFYHIIEMVQ